MDYYIDYTFTCKSWWYHGKSSIKKGDILDLRMEPENKHDSTAVAITKNGRKIGYVPKGWSKEITEALKEGRNLNVTVVEESRYDYAPSLRIYDMAKPAPKKDDGMALTCMVLLAILGIFGLVLGVLAASCIAVLY